MSLLGLFKPRLYIALPAPSACRRLRLQFVDESLEYAGPQFAKLSRLQKLCIQGDVSKFSRSDSQFSLPPEIGQLRTLRRLVLLNLPIDFPEWIINLTNLRYLTVRGTDLISIPSWIHELRNLRSLEIANCALTSLPVTLRQMHNLRKLWLSDTQLHNFNPEQFPPHLRVLSFAGSGCYQQKDLAQLQKALKGTRIYPDPNHPRWRIVPTVRNPACSP